MIILLLTRPRRRRDPGVYLESCTHLAAADLAVLHLAVDLRLPADRRLEILDLVLVDDHPHPVVRDVLVRDGDGLDVPVPAPDTSLDTFRHLPDLQELVLGLGIVRAQEIRDADLFPSLLASLSLLPEEGCVDGGAETGTVLTTPAPTTSLLTLT